MDRSRAASAHHDPVPYIDEASKKKTPQIQALRFGPRISFRGLLRGWPQIFAGTGPPYCSTVCIVGSSHSIPDFPGTGPPYYSTVCIVGSSQFYSRFPLSIGHSIIGLLTSCLFSLPSWPSSLDLSETGDKGTELFAKGQSLGGRNV